MSVRIVPDNTNHQRTPFRAGGQVTGNVHVLIPSASFSTQNAFPQVVLWWTGVSRLRFEQEVWFMSSMTVTRHFRSSATLFHHKCVLTERAFVPASSHRGEDGGTLVFPFSVNLPAFAEPISVQDQPTAPNQPSSTPLETDLYSPDDPWPSSMTYDSRVGAGSTPQRLPSSSSRPFFYSTGPALRLRLEGSIEYALQADLPNMNEVSSAKEVLTVVNTLPELTSAEANRWEARQYEAQVRVHRAEEGSSRRRLSLIDRASSVFKKNLDPTVGLSITFESKQAIFLKEPDDEYLPFRISLKWQVPVPERSSTGSQSREMPKVYIIRLRLCLRGNLAARPNPLQKVDYIPRSFDGRDEREIFDWKDASKARDGLEIAPGTAWEVGPNLGATFGLFRASLKKQSGNSQLGRAMELVPNFSAPNLVRNYSLSWEMMLSCAGQEVKWKCGADGELGPAVTLEGGSHAVQVSTEQALPAYEV